MCIARCMPAVLIILNNTLIYWDMSLKQSSKQSGHLLGAGNAGGPFWVVSMEQGLASRSNPTPQPGAGQPAGSPGLSSPEPLG